MLFRSGLADIPHRGAVAGRRVVARIQEAAGTAEGRGTECLPDICPGGSMIMKTLMVVKGYWRDNTKTSS